MTKLHAIKCKCTCYGKPFAGNIIAFIRGPLEYRLEADRRNVEFYVGPESRLPDPTYTLENGALDIVEFLYDQSLEIGF